MLNIRSLSLAGATTLALAVAPLGAANAHSFNLNIDDHEDLLEQLIELDAEGIEDLREELVDARAEIADAVVEIEEAKEEVKGIPFAGMVANIAFRVASVTVSKATESALDEVRTEMTKAERELDNRRTDLGEAEYAETQGAFAMVREELVHIEDALDDLMDALK